MLASVGLPNSCCQGEGAVLELPESAGPTIPGCQGKEAVLVSAMLSGLANSCRQGEAAGLASIVASMPGALLDG